MPKIDAKRVLLEEEEVDLWYTYESYCWMNSGDANWSLGKLTVHCNRSDTHDLHAQGSKGSKSGYNSNHGHSGTDVFETAEEAAETVGIAETGEGEGLGCCGC